MVAFVHHNMIYEPPLIKEKGGKGRAFATSFMNKILKKKRLKIRLKAHDVHR